MDVALATLWPLRILAMLLGVYVVYRVLRSAVQTFVLPHAITDEVARAVFLMVRGLFDLRTHMATTYAERDRIMAFYAPAALLTLTATWLALVVIAYTLIYWGVELGNLDHDFIVSGSSLFTLGFAEHPGRECSCLYRSRMRAAPGRAVGRLPANHLQQLATTRAHRGPARSARRDTPILMGDDHPHASDSRAGAQTVAPYAPWISDRSNRYRHPVLSVWDRITPWFDRSGAL